MVTLVIVKNPFSPQDGREVKYIEPKGTLADLLEEYKMPGVDLQATVNGYTIEDKEINDEDFIVIYPVIEKGGKGGKGILGIIAAVALSVVSFGIASGGWLAGIGIKAGTFAAYAAATAVMFIGSSLMGRFMGQKVDVGGYDAENEPTYSWGGIQTMEGQNNAVPLTYGKVKSGGQTIGKFVSTEDNEEYLNWLVACGEGELAITDIKLNDNPIGNYEAVTCEVRSGTNDQAVIPYFNDTYFTKNLGYHMTTVNTWYTDTAQGTATDGLIFKIELPNGLYHGNDDGKFSNNYVDITMQYKLTSSSTWLTLTGDRINGKSNKAIRKEYRVDNIPSGSYDVRVMVTAFGRDDATRDMHEIYWTGITSIVYDDFVYPCQALIGIRAKATDQLSGTPSLTFIKERTTVFVYNPYDEAYEEHEANNPAWACYDFIHQARELRNINYTGEDEDEDAYAFEVRGAAKELMRYDDFVAWADFCDDKGYKVNIEINTVGEVLELVNQKIAPIGHGLVVRFGTKYGCIYDHVQMPVQMFGMGNILQGSFNEEFMKVADRANCVEVTFMNKDAGYERDVLTIYGDTYDTDGYSKTAQMTFDGITDYQQAYREGKYQLYSNQYLLRTVSFEAGIDSIACTVGDVVLISHDVPKWANSGRIDKASAGIIDVLPQSTMIFDAENDYRLPIPSVVEYGINNEVIANAYSTDVPAVDMADVLRIGGKSIVWNQLVDTNTESVTLINGRKYYTEISNVASIVEGDGNAVAVASGDMVCDLSRMFGIGNEPFTVQEFVALIPNTDTTYNAGTIVHSGVTTVKSVGKNLADPAIFFGAMSSATIVADEDGDYYKVTAANLYTAFRQSLVETNKSPVFTQQNLTLSFDIRVDASVTSTLSYLSAGFFDAITGTSLGNVRCNYTAEWQRFSVTVENAGKCKVRFSYGRSRLLNIKNFQIEASDVATPYEPYQAITYTVPSAVTELEGYGWSAGNAYNYIDYERKKFVKCVDRVDLGTLTWAYTSSYDRFYSTSLVGKIKPNPNGKNVVGNIVCADYQTITYNSINSAVANNLDQVVALGASGTATGSQRNIQLRDTSANTTSITEFKTAMSGKYLFYEKITPVEIDISEYLDSTCLLPCELQDWENKSYILQWRDADDTLHSKICDVVSSADGWTRITINASPQANDVFDIAEQNIGSKPFVVKSITRAQDFTRRISCIEYNENVYNENYDIPVINYSTWQGEPKNVTGLTTSITQTKNSFGEDVGRLVCSWNIPDTGGTFTVLLSTDGNNWKIAKSGITENNCEVNVSPNTSYYVKVITVLGVNQSTGTQVGLIFPTGDGSLPQVTNLTGYTRYRGVKDGDERYEIHLVWTPPLLANYQSCDVWYKTNHAQVSTISMTDGVAVNQLGFQKDWKYAGNGYSDFTMSDVTTGDTYRFAVVTKDALGNVNVADLSPYVDVVATAKTETPNTPDGFSFVVGNDDCTASWKEVANADIQYYEIRDNDDAGKEDVHLLARTSGTSTAVPVTTRTGTLYLYAKSVLGKYSAPAVLEYVKVAPPKPNSPQLNTKLGGFSVESTIPAGCKGMRVYISGVNEEEYYTQNSVYNYPCGAGIYDVQVAYVDYFGVGEKSATSRVVVKALVDESLLAEQAITKDKLNNALQIAVDDAVQSVQDIARIDATIETIDVDITNVEAQAQGIITELEKAPANCGYKAVSDLKTDVDNVSITVASNKQTQDGINSTVGSRLTVAEGGITAITTNLNKGAGNTGYAAITQLNTSVSGLQSQVEEIYEMTDEGIAPDIAAMKSQIQQNSRSIETMVSNLNSSASGNTYSAISSLAQTADSISSTVSSNKTAQDAINAGTTSSGLLTKINQNASGITAVANRTTTNETNISALQVSVNGISSTVATNKDNQDDVNESLQSSITQNATNITAIVNNLNSLDSATSTYSAFRMLDNSIDAVASRVDTTESNISSLQVTTNGISTTVANNKTAQDKINDGTSSSGLLTKINQNATSISAVVTNLNDSTKARNYTAIQVMQDGIASKVAMGDVESYLQQDHTGFYIKGSLIQIDGDTVIGNNIIKRDMIQSSAINAGKIASNAVTSAKIAANAVTAAKINVDSLSAITATIGTLRTATTGARTEIKDNLIEVYDSNGTLRVRMGVW